MMTEFATTRLHYSLDASQEGLSGRERHGRPAALADAFRMLGHGVAPSTSFGRTREWFRAHFAPDPAHGFSRDADTAGQPTVVRLERPGQRSMLNAAFHALGHGVSPHTGFERTRDWFRSHGAV